MRFQRLRLTGFKSFVDPTEFRIEPGLTGIVGPNGCGKSNLLEALRWVMGANSAKAMRAGGMDDVIFAGSAKRPSRNHADVTLTIDNAERRAPAAYNDHPVLEVVRRIDRGSGSSYRINGKEVRARDVQLLFADASTGSNSPALVRQGQISELIAAKPQNRRLILEEAAGVSGLHSRRHEAELRLRAAEANLARLDDVAQALEGGLIRLRREARQAERYRRLSAEIRTLRGAVLLARWNQAGQAAEQLRTEAAAAARDVEAAARSAAISATAAAAADAGLAPLREAETIAAAVLGTLAIDRDRIEREAEALAAEVKRGAAEIARIDADHGRESQMTEDALAALARLMDDISRLETEVSGAPERILGLKAALAKADTARAEADAGVERLAAAVAAEDARRRAAAARISEAEARVARCRRTLDQARAERAALGSLESPQIAEARDQFEQALAALAAARETQAGAEDAQTAAQAAEAQAREAARRVDEQVSRLTAEARGLAQIVAPQLRGGFAPALDGVAPARGYEMALAAALGDDLEAALDRRAPAHWAGAAAPAPTWPPGASPLANHVQAPPQLAARLAHVALVDRAQGEALARLISPGCRLVSREGDLWRWDGFTARAEAKRPAAVRLEQKSRLAEVEAEIEALAPFAQQARDALTAARLALAKAEAAQKAARREPPACEQRLGQTRGVLERLEREDARREAQAQALDNMIARFTAELAEAETLQAAGLAEGGVEGDGEDLRTALIRARSDAGPAREAAAAARSALDAETRERDGRVRRLSALTRERDDWTRRAEGAAERLNVLERDRIAALSALDLARQAPQQIESRRVALLDAFAAAETRRSHTHDALQAGEAARSEAERGLRAADAAAAQARESRVALDARLEAAVQRLAELADQIRETTQLDPDALARRLADEAVAIPADTAGLEAHLSALERQRESIGPVNLRAEDEARDSAVRLETMQTERADLTGAIARLRQGIEELNSEGRERLIAAFDVVNGHFQTLFQTLFEGGQAELSLVESEDPLEAGLEIYACPPGKRMATMSLMSGGEQALTAAALIFAVFLANPAPICVLDEVDAPLDDANVDRFCNMLDEMRRRTETRFIAITHNPVTMARMDRLFGVTMAERGVSQLVSVDLRQAEALAAE